MFAQIDIDGSGSIDYTEFVMATMNEKNMQSNEKLMQAFRMFDKDGSGTISAEEIKEVLGYNTSNSRVIEDIMKEVDENGDGEIQFEEFVHMMRKLTTNE